MDQEFVAQQDASAAAPDSAPVVQDNQAEPTAPADQNPDNTVNADSVPAQDDQPVKEPKAVQELIRVRKRAQEAERELAYYKGMAAAQQKSQEQPVQDTNPTVITPPKFEDFDDIDQYESAKEQYLINRAKAEFQAEEFKKAQRQIQQQIDQQFAEKLHKAAELDPEVIEIVQDVTLPISNDMAGLIKQSDLSIELLKHFNENRTVAQKLMAMTPAQVGLEIGRIEASIAAKTKTPEPVKKVSMAPEPMQTVTPSGITDPDPDTMPIEEWMKRYGGPSKRR